jgi:hypothetical protein
MQNSRLICVRDPGSLDLRSLKETGTALDQPAPNTTARSIWWRSVMKRVWFASACVLVSLAASSALAGVLATDPLALPGYRGTASFDASMGSDLLFIDLDYAVFAPGQYPDGQLNSEYVYAYQAFSLATSTRGLATVSIGLEPNSGAHNEGEDPTYGEPGGISIDEALGSPTSILFEFFPDLNAGENSTVMLFTSPYPPVLGPGSIQSGGLSDQQLVPTPAPEPTAALLLLPALFILRRR